MNLILVTRLELSTNIPIIYFLGIKLLKALGLRSSEDPRDLTNRSISLHISNIVIITKYINY